MNEPKFDIKNIKAIIGLGNPGQKYYKTRHSIGFRIADVISQKFNANFNSSDLMEYVQISLNDDSLHSIYLIKPQTFMNASGQVIPFLLKKGIKAENILVIHDELEKRFGHISLRFGGSARGHNGLLSIISVIGKEFWRLRFGIGRPEDRSQVSSYVLSNFTIEQEVEVDNLIQDSIKKIFQA